MSKIINFNKKENLFTKFINKYFGWKYSMVFAVGKNVLSQKPTVTGTISMIIAMYCIYFIARYSEYIWYGLIVYAIAYGIKITIKLRKLKKNKKQLKTIDNGTNNKHRRIKL